MAKDIAITGSIISIKRLVKKEPNKRPKIVDKRGRIGDYERGLPGVEVYFAHPYHSWERGCNENANGLLRQYFPKGMDFSKITQEMLDKAVDEINNRPRKRLNWKSPNQKMWQNHALLAKKKCWDLK